MYETEFLRECERDFECGYLINSKNIARPPNEGESQSSLEIKKVSRTSPQWSPCEIEWSRKQLCSRLQAAFERINSRDWRLHLACDTRETPGPVMNPNQCHIPIVTASLTEHGGLASWVEREIIQTAKTYNFRGSRLPQERSYRWTRASVCDTERERERGRRKKKKGRRTKKYYRYYW